jgi:hypothetical protein
LGLALIGRASMHRAAPNGRIPVAAISDGNPVPGGFDAGPRFGVEIAQGMRLVRGYIDPDHLPQYLFIGRESGDQPQTAGNAAAAGAA